MTKTKTTQASIWSSSTTLHCVTVKEEKVDILSQKKFWLTVDVATFCSRKEAEKFAVRFN